MGKPVGSEGGWSFPCLKCHGRTRCVDARPAPGGSGIRRRRRCVPCGHRFTTYEIACPEKSLSRGLRNVVGKSLVVLRTAEANIVRARQDAEAIASVMDQIEAAR